MRQMVYTTNDIAYLQDIEALNKKIEALAEQSHSNDIQTFCMQDEMREEFATVDEVNNVLTNYVQKSDLPPAVDMSEYRKKDDLSVKVMNKGLVQLPITNGPYEPEGLTSEFYYTSFIPFQEGARLVGKTGSSIDYDFDII